MMNVFNDRKSKLTKRLFSILLVCTLLSTVFIVNGFAYTDEEEMDLDESNLICDEGSISEDDMYIEFVEDEEDNSFEDIDDLENADIQINSVASIPKNAKAINNKNVGSKFIKHKTVFVEWHGIKPIFMSLYCVEPGDYYLQEDVNFDIKGQLEEIYVYGNVNLYLNGHTITDNAKEGSGHFFQIDNLPGHDEDIVRTFNIYGDDSLSSTIRNCSIGSRGTIEARGTCDKIFLNCYNVRMIKDTTLNGMWDSSVCMDRGTVNLYNCQMQGSGGVGIASYDDVTINVEGSDISGYETAIRLSSNYSHQTMTLKDCNIRDNLLGISRNSCLNASDAGLKTGNLKMENTIIQDCGLNSNAGKGGIRVHNCNVEMNNTKILNNCGTHAGGIYASYSDIKMSNTIVSGNKADADRAAHWQVECAGGGIYLAGCSTICGSGIICNNTAKNGGGIYLANQSCSISGLVIASNTATEKGGGIYAKKDSRISGGAINTNKAENGGGIYVEGDATIMENEASNAGGGVFARRDVNLSNTTIKSNRAPVGQDIYKEPKDEK